MVGQIRFIHTMKKIIQCVYLLLLTVILIFSISNGLTNYINKNVYMNNYEVNYTANPEKNDLTQIQQIDNYMINNPDINFYQVTYNENVYNIFGNIDKSMKQLPKFVNKSLQENDLTSLANNGINGVYYFKGSETSLKKFEDFINTEELGTISYKFNDYRFSMKIKMLSLILLCILLYIILLHSYIDKQALELTIRLIEGRKTIYSTFFWLIYVFLFLVGLVVILSIANIYYLKEILYIFIPIAAFVMLCSILVIKISIMFIDHNKIAYVNKKEEKNIRIYVILGIFSFIIISILILSTNSLMANLGTKTNQLSQWSEYEEYYNLKIKSIGIENDFDSDIANENNIKFKKIYQKLDSEEGAILIDSSGFYSSMDPTRYDYENNSCSYKIAPNCRQITINENYLKDNPILSKDDVNVIDKIDHSQYTLNILVPQKYSSEENKIVDLYRKYYYFNMVEVHQIYDEDYTFDIEKLKVNPIYYEDNSTFFTYNTDTGKLNNNQLTDVIAVIDNGTFDASFYYANMTTNVIIKKSKDEESFYNKLLIYFEEENIGNQYNGVESIIASIQYLIMYLKSAIRYNVAVLLFSIVTLIYITYIISIYKQYNNKMEYAISYIEVNDIKGVIKNNLFFEVVLYTCFGIVLSVFSRNIIPIILAILIITIKYLMEVVIGYNFIKNKFLNIIKGE